MSLTVTQLNGDASFLLSFEPIAPFQAEEPYRVLLDPWLPGPEPRAEHQDDYSNSYDDFERDSRRVYSIKDLPEPDLVIISQCRSDHCNKKTLKQLPPTNTKTQILAEPSAAKQIRSWKHFAKGKVRTLEKWGDPRVAKKDSTIRIDIPSHIPNADPGELTISLIPQKRDHWRLHSAIGITYRPPPSRPMSFSRPSISGPTPTVPTPKTSSFNLRRPSPPPLSAGIANLKAQAQHFAAICPPPTPPESPRTLRRPRSVRSIVSVAPENQDRSLSVIFAPHGITYRSLEQYTTSHLVTEAALPLTALIHCFDSVSTPWWLPGSVNSGITDGHQIATKLGAKAWISAHDNERRILHHRWMTRKARTHRYRKAEVRRALDQAAWDSKLKAPQTEIMALQITDEVTLTNEGVWEMPKGTERS